MEAFSPLKINNRLRKIDMKIKSKIRVFIVAFFSLFSAQLIAQLDSENRLNEFKSDILKEANSSFLIQPKTRADSVVANFTASDTIITVWDAVHFTNLSTGNPTFQKWYFPGASPSISYDTNPFVVYHTPGIYDVTLEVYCLNGSDTLIREEYIEVLPEELNLPPGWGYEETIAKHPIFLTVNSNPRIFEERLKPGDFIGVFYLNDEDSLKCGGAIEWNDSLSVAVIANGDNTFTNGKDGFAYGEAFTFKLYSMLKQEEFEATPVFDPMLPFTFFVPSGMSGLLDLSAGKSVEIVFPQGWSGISSHVIPWENLMDEVFNSNLEDLIIISDGENFFKPDINVNTLGVWENKGYYIKMNNEVSIVFDGYPSNDLNFTIQEGWNIIPVPIECEVYITDVLQNNISKISIIKEIAGLNIYWPNKDIFSLEKLMPGKAYAINATEGFTIVFVPCY